MPVRGRLLQYEGWDLANSASFPAVWTTTATGATVNVQSGGGRVSLAGVSGGYAESGAAWAVRLPVYDYEIVFDVAFSSVAAESYGAVFLGDVHNTIGTPTNGVGVVLAPLFSTITIQQRSAGVQADLAQGIFTYGAATTHRVKFARWSGWSAAKMWTAGAEPSDWAVQVSAPLFRGPPYGLPMLGLSGGNVAAATTMTIDNLSITELASGRRRLTSVR